MPQQDLRHPYQIELEAIGKSGTVTIHRRDASSVSGAILAIKGHGCTIRFQDPHGRPGTDVHLFVSYHDIRGIAIYIVAFE